MSTRIILTADWHTESASPELESALAESATVQMANAIRQGYASGELAANISTTDDDKGGVDYRGWWTLTVAPAGTQELPFGIQVGEGFISSTLGREFEDDGVVDDVGQASADALESFLLALHMEGVSLDDPRISNALKTAVEAIGNNL